MISADGLIRLIGSRCLVGASTAPYSFLPKCSGRHLTLCGIATVTTRTKIGVIGVVLLTAGGYLHWGTLPEGISNTDAFEAAGLRIGVVMIVLWIAYPELVKLPTWISIATFVATPIIALRPRVALVILPVLLLTWILYPKAKKKPGGDSSQQ